MAEGAKSREGIVVVLAERRHAGGNPLLCFVPTFCNVIFC